MWGGGELDGANVPTRGGGQTRAEPPTSVPLEKRIEAAAVELECFVREQGVDKDEAHREDDLRRSCRHKFIFPSPSRLAVKYLVVPPSSAASERAFSLVGNVVTENATGSAMTASMHLFSSTVRTGGHGPAVIRRRTSAGRINEFVSVS